MEMAHTLPPFPRHEKADITAKLGFEREEAFLR